MTDLWMPELHARSVVGHRNGLDGRFGPEPRVLERMATEAYDGLGRLVGVTPPTGATPYQYVYAGGRIKEAWTVDPENIDEIIAAGGYRGLERIFAAKLSPEAVIDEIKKSGLRGRGGAGFPTGMKWEFTRKGPGEEKYIVCNDQYGPERIEKELIFLGLMAMLDPPRPEVMSAIQRLRQASIRLVMITGDYGLTAESLARRVVMLISKNTRIITGAELDEIDDEELNGLLAEEVIYARMAPA